jgi:hypothetical protein
MKFNCPGYARLFLLICALAASVPILVAGSALQTAGSAGAPLTDAGWPRKFTSGTKAFSIYQPQIEQWMGNNLEGRAAVAVTDSQASETTYGVLWFSARTEIDKVNRLVTMADFRVTKVSFPGAADKALVYQSLMQQRAPRASDAIALDRLLADLAMNAGEKQSPGYELKNDPPEVFFSTRPAILVLIDGAPVLRQVPETRLKRVINTRVVILQDESRNRFYLHLMDGWMEAAAIAGPWVIARKLPADLSKAFTSVMGAGRVDPLDGAAAGADRKPSLEATSKTGALPTIYTSLGPSELLQTQGDPQVEAIEGTQLIYVVNTENDIFVDAASQDHYVLFSGRWFRSQSMNGPWEFVPGTSLPADFSKIPPTHAKANVLVSIPGTPQAKEALIANDIPQTATITRSQAALQVSYDGQPLFKPVESTTLSYAVNSSTPVIAAGATSYYAVQNGVWFTAVSSTGPWSVATSVPTVIYTIPPSSPVHNVTYVKIYGSTPQVVYVGYTPGYYGTIVSSANVVVYGTGWYYPPYIGAAWHGWSYTYGYGVGFGWSTAAGWSVSYGVGYGWSTYYQPAPWYGPAAGYYAYAGTRAAWANPYTGNYGKAGAYTGVNAATGTRYAARGGTNTNVYTGTTVTGGGGVAYNPQTGVIRGGGAGAAYNPATGQTGGAGGNFAYNAKTGVGVAAGNNNVYAGRDGNVYRYNQSTGVQQHTSDGWQTVKRPADLQNVQGQQAARAAGQQRWESFKSAGGQRARPSSRGGRRR